MLLACVRTVGAAASDSGGVAVLRRAADVSDGGDQARIPAAAVRAPAHPHVRLRVLPLVARAAHDWPHHRALRRPAAWHTLPRLVVPGPGESISLLPQLGSTNVEPTTSLDFGLMHAPNSWPSASYFAPVFNAEPCVSEWGSTVGSQQ